MYKNLKWRILSILIVIFGAIALAYPLEEKISLGLDLQGGMHLVLEVKVEKAVEASLERLADDIKRDIGEEDLEVDRIKAIFEKLQINIRMVDELDLPPVKKVMENYVFFRAFCGVTYFNSRYHSVVFFKFINYFIYNFF